MPFAVFEEHINDVVSSLFVCEIFIEGFKLTTSVASTAFQAGPQSYIFYMY